MTRQMGPAERAAHQYADTGWPVFGLVPGEKSPVTRHGFLDATTGHREIERTWARNPDRNVGIATGAPGPDVVDVDHHGEAGSGYAAWNQLQRAGLVRDPKAIVSTPSGGLHAYFAGTSQRSGSLPGRHLDWRAAGGYVAAPPSRVGGRPYEEVIEHRASSATVDFSAIRGLLEPVRDRQAQQWQQDGRPRDLGHLAAWVAGQAEGNRNGGLYWAACRAAEAGDATALDAIREAALAAGLGEREAGRTIASALRTADRGRPQIQITLPGTRRREAAGAAAQGNSTTREDRAVSIRGAIRDRAAQISQAARPAAGRQPGQDRARAAGQAEPDSGKTRAAGRYGPGGSGSREAEAFWAGGFPPDNEHER
ncbi:MAG TPA: bifunctional DNA primase/polymerase [Streptosporangiaceae bacterium]|nr:bifunctional DNA primase/polymerase [Streptosporangiaceae bacterium]